LNPFRYVLFQAASLAVRAAPVLILAACADSRLGTIEARYQKPTLPVHFRTAEDRTEIALTARWNDQAPLHRRLAYRERSDGVNLHLSRDTANHAPYADIEERFRFAREPMLLSGSVTWQQDVLYSGLAGGIVPEHPRSFHLGAFAGFSGRFGPIIASGGLGVFRNRMRTDVRYWGYDEDALFRKRAGEDSIYAPDSLSGWSDDWELRANAAIRMGGNPRFAPFLVAETGWVRFWRWSHEGTPTDDPVLVDLGLGGGLEMRLFPRVPLRSEIRFGTAWIPGASKAADASGAPGESYLEGGLRAGWEW
jgi:hypothetical protein